MTFQRSLGRFRAAVNSGPWWHLRVARGLACGAVLALLVLAPLSPAAAHDSIEAAEPADGSVLASVPAAVKLAFNNPPIALGAAVLVTDQHGINQADGGVLITDNVVSQAVKAGAPAGRYTVIWRVVSADSHPIEGRFTFTAGNTSASSPSTAQAASAPSTAGRETAQPAGNPWALVAGGSLLAAGLLAAARAVRRGLHEGNDGAS